MKKLGFGALMGIWSPAAGPAGAGGTTHIEFLQDLDFVCRVPNGQGGGGGRGGYATATLPKNLINTNVLYLLIAMLLVKLYLKAKFPSFINPTGTGDAHVQHIINALNVGFADINRQHARIRLT